MRDEKEGRKEGKRKHDQLNNKAKQHSTPKAVKKNELPQVGLEPTTHVHVHVKACQCLLLLVHVHVRCILSQVSHYLMIITMALLLLQSLDLPPTE